MTDYLGNLTWWKIYDTDMPHQVLCSTLGDDTVSAPAQPLPVDVFRRVTGSRIKKIYALEDSANLEITLATVDARGDTLLLRHMVGTLRNKRGATVKISKLGDVAFHKPPRGHPTQWRLRVVPGSEFPDQTADFAADLRASYDRGVKGSLDAQALRRVVRSHLSKMGATYLEGPYLLDTKVDYSPLERLFQALGPDGFMHTVPLVDTPQQRAFIARLAGTTREETDMTDDDTIDMTDLLAILDELREHIVELDGCRVNIEVKSKPINAAKAEINRKLLYAAHMADLVKIDIMQSLPPIQGRDAALDQRGLAPLHDLLGGHHVRTEHAGLG